MGTLGAVTQSREPHATRGGSGPRAAGGGLADAPRIASAPGPAGLRLSGHLPREPVAFTPWSGLRRRPWALIKARPPAQCQAGWGLHLVPAGREAARVPVQSQGQAPRGRCALGEQGQVGRAVEPRRVRVCVGWAGCRRGLHGALRVPGGQVHRSLAVPLRPGSPQWGRRALRGRPAKGGLVLSPGSLCGWACLVLAKAVGWDWVTTSFCLRGECQAGCHPAWLPCPGPCPLGCGPDRCEGHCRSSAPESGLGLCPWGHTSPVKAGPGTWLWFSLAM